jgi:tetratricopeptide (TPR) repeat protein
MLLVVAAGCAKPEVRCPDPVDNPEHHYLMGMELIDDNDLVEAYAKFDRAVYCDKGYGPAYAGRAIVRAKKTLEEKGPEYKQVDVYKAYEDLQDAKKAAENTNEEFAWRMASMRVYTLLKPKGWIKDVESDYKKAMKLRVNEQRLLYYEGREAASYYMGAGYLEARMFAPARDRFSDVLNNKKEGKWHPLADAGWKKADKIVRAMGGLTIGDVGKAVALMDTVPRGEMAALLIDELKLDKLFAGRIPVRSEVEKLKPEFTPADIVDDKFRHEILTLMKWKVRGLEPVYDNSTRAYLFKPDGPVTRKEFALALEDVIIKITGDESISAAFFGHQRSPYPDVEPTSAWYNAVMNVTTKSLMETELSGEAIRVLRQRLNIY